MGAIALVGLAISAASAAYSGYAASQSASYQSAIAAHQAKIAEENALISRQTTEEQQKRIDWKSRSQSGAIKAAMAAGGVDVGSGSASDVQKSQNALNVDISGENQREGQQKWWGFKNQQDTFTAQSKLYQMQSNSDMWSGMLGGASAFAKGMGNYNMNYGGY
jgi:hypothetical protein